MKLYLISQSVNNGYNTYDSAVVAAESEDEAKEIHPSEYWILQSEYDDYWTRGNLTKSYEVTGCWAQRPSQVEVKYLGEAAEGTQSGVILASYNAG